MYYKAISKIAAAIICLFAFCGTVNMAKAQISQTEFDALKALYNSTNGTNWTNKTGWENINSLTANDITSGLLYGVTIEGTNVTQINLQDNGLVGSIPVEIGNLTNLYYLLLYNNQLSGSIPVEIGNLTNLQQLILY